MLFWIVKVDSGAIGVLCDERNLGIIDDKYVAEPEILTGKSYN